MRHIGILIVFASNLAFSQTGSVRGRVVSETDGQPLVGANVILQGTLRGTITDVNGEYLFSNIPAGSYSLTFSLVGYRRETRPNIVISEGTSFELTVELTPVAIQTEPVVVTASKREQSLHDSPVSVSVMDAAAIAYRNSVTVEDALRYVPGVNITESQVNIRGSSGYSRGVGSRVLMLVDGIPFLTGDTGELNFETIPIGQVDRIEVVKGASSALYGSSALGGVVNVITKPIHEKPETRIRTYGGFYGSPSFKQWDWGGGTRFMEGLLVSHSQRFNNLGLLVYGSRIADDGYRQNDYRRRYNGYLKARYDLSSFDALTMTFNLFHQKRGSFLYWKNLGNALVPPDVQQGDIVKSTRFYLSGLYNHIVSSDLFYTVKGMWFSNKWDDTVDTLTNNSKSDIVRAEVQATWSATATHILTFGVEGNIDRVRADLFGSRSGGGVALYVQDEIQVTDKLKATLGVRFDFQDVDALESSGELNPKIGLVYSPVEGTAVRGWFGRGFRTPSVAEAFVTTEAGGLEVVPNPNLKPERSYSFELGASQFLSDIALIDVALFRSEFSDLIEPGFVPTDLGLKVQFNNVTRARVQGIEASVTLGLFDRALFTTVGYTYVSPRDLSKDDILKYRPRHLLYVSTITHLGIFDIGVDFRYISRVERIDEEFVTLGIVVDGNKRVATYIADLRLGANFTEIGFPLSATFSINNILQYNYVELIGNIAPPRNMVLTLETRL